MAKLELLLMFLVAAAGVSMVLADCDYATVCRLYLYHGNDEDQACRFAISYLNCLQKRGIDNPDCSRVKNALEKIVKDSSDFLENHGCDGAVSLVSSLVVTLGLSGVVYLLTSAQ